ncbi:MAG: bifunctional diaminohydroxyphosphoribosylaminopyrimidine deaminase/5-amino-6-(5-phosphoribosylamino)uracil reductase RibD, partial [Planctomycetia bacterium]|nr:bifunctional diaminohydroxyphosphoribosylaminopyrimidine deaminase/5-amino-6-(5-phosphoribosylamino)uracil reductase RibD [Planctomycetia bacterium]
ALALAEKGRGFVEPNPMVGAVVLDSAGQLAGEGWHQKFGEAHAEIHALAAAGERARGGTLVVTLEPCCHWGKTPPCTDAILRAGIIRVVSAMADPFPQVSGGGLALLKTAGVEVFVGLCEAEARALNAPYLKLIQMGRPWVHAKWAMSLDGKIATRTGDSQWISGEESRKRAHELRGRVDAVVIGRGTMVMDDPLLTARPPGPRLAARVVLSASGELPERCRLRMTARKTPVIVFTLAENAHRLRGWTTDGAEVVAIDDTSLSLEAVLDDFGRRKFTNVMFEGGAALLGSLVDGGFADEFHVFIAPKLIGGTTALSPVGGAGTDRMVDALSLHRVSVEKLGDDAYVRGFSAKS